MKLRTEVRTLRKTLPQQTEKHNKLFSKTYCGEGFYVNKKGISLEKSCWGYDIHWAYGGSLVKDVFPLTTELTDEETELGIFYCKLSYFRPRYPQFDYTIFANHIRNGELYLTNKDYEIFTDMYESDIEIVEKGYFKTIGKLSEETRELVIDRYNTKQLKKAEDDEDYEEYKKILEMTYYGKQAQQQQYANGRKNSEKRNERVFIALWQSAHIRYREWQLFKKNMKQVLYMNTDSIIADEMLVLKCKNEIGEYDREYENVPILFIRRNAYVVLNNDGTIRKQVVSGIVEKLSVDKLRRLRNGFTVIANTKDENGNLKPIRLRPTFLTDYIEHLLDGGEDYATGV